MANSRRTRGFATERIVANYLREWWEFATVGRGAGPDLVNVPFDIEIKSRAKLDIAGTFRQIEARTAKTGVLGFACFRLNGQGEKSVHEYAALIRFEDLVKLLLKAGYKDMPINPKDSDITKCLGCGGWIFEGMECATCNLLNKEK